ncbi:MAG: hypothetical protein ABI792_06170 [bacterium]
MSVRYFHSIIFNLLLVIVFGMIISYIDLHNDEVQSAVMLLLIFSFILGYKDPHRAWLYSILLALSIITGLLFSKTFGFVPKGSPPDNIFWTLLALIPAFAGGYAGVLMKILFKKSIS